MSNGDRRDQLSEREDGFTLVELIVAMFVMAIVILAIIGIQASALTTNADSNARQQATSYANEAMEQMRAIPWNVLKKGMSSNYQAASGGDPFVAGDVLTVEGTSIALQVAPSGLSDQDLSQAWPPLFDVTGSHTQVEADGAGRGTEFTVRSYVTRDQAGQDDAYGLAVVVTWDSIRHGNEEITTLFSTAYAPSGGCGDLNNAPFLASCQALYYSQASSGNVVFTASATSLPENEEDPALPRPLFESSPFHQIQVGTSSTVAHTSSQQTTTATALGQYGGVRWNDDDTDNQPEDFGWLEGYEAFSLDASDDDVNPEAAPANPSDITMSANNSSHTIGGGTSGLSLTARADDPRDGTLDASTSLACSVGAGAATIPATQPCASSRMNPASTYSGYLLLNAGSDIVRLGRVQQESGSSVETAWAGRFVEGLAGNGNTGCEVLSGSGCASAGVNRQLGTISVGAIVGSSWDGGDAASGLVTITGYNDSVLAQRGTSQTTTAAQLSRGGSLQYWNGSGYSSLSISPSASGSGTIPEVTWSNALVTVTASGAVSVSRSSDVVDGVDPVCAEEACSVNASTGTVTATINYTVEPTVGDPFILSVKTTLNGSSASASYKEPENA
ncbi:prepilin-type N-terminal cleavage/methylation domain-containing protein [Demequina flava]|uniref:prepilin-type N-terminal cleavage/methylation domain-containing protein n=1 Tax=Demequina flava TaxID=1095025 RepID=UPI000783E599|nr:prepilin-type N-terminal cleavage/methylation domain-containing protein [Demequina flava]